MFKGEVKTFSPGKGFGFIEWAGKKDLFVHYSNIIAKDSFKNLEKGQIVSFKVRDGAKGPEAYGVKVLPNAIVTGKIRFWDIEKAFGFITSEEKEEVFLPLHLPI